MIVDIFEETIRALGVCRNCLCTDCGCCVGCGGVNADADFDIYYWFHYNLGMSTGHGYVCVM